MNYFAVVSILWGLVAVLKWPVMLLLPGHSSTVLGRAYSSEQRSWIWVVVAFGLAFTALTWYMHLTTAVPYSIVLTFLISLMVIKLASLVFSYSAFHRFAQGLLGDQRQLNTVNVTVFLTGLVLLYLGLLGWRMNKHGNYSYAALGMLLGTVVGGGVGVILFAITGQALFIAVAAAGTGIGLVLGAGIDRHKKDSAG